MARKVISEMHRLLGKLWRRIILNPSSKSSISLSIFLPNEERKFLKLIRSRSDLTSHSQLYQDFLPLFFLGAKADGFYVEVGVGNGVNNSNTYLLEKDFGWGGILIEPNSDFHESIKSNRAGTLFKCAAGPENGYDSVLFKPQDGEYSFISNSYAGSGERRITKSSELVEIRSINSILTESQSALEVDFLSIDVEGFELKVLEGIDFIKWNFQVVCIEHNYNLEKRREIHKILEEFGYKQVLRVASQFDSFFVHSNLCKEA